MLRGIAPSPKRTSACLDSAAVHSELRSDPHLVLPTAAAARVPAAEDTEDAGDAEAPLLMYDIDLTGKSEKLQDAVKRYNAAVAAYDEAVATVPPPPDKEVDKLARTARALGELADVALEEDPPANTGAKNMVVD